MVVTSYKDSILAILPIQYLYKSWNNFMLEWEQIHQQNYSPNNEYTSYTIQVYIDIALFCDSLHEVTNNITNYYTSSFCVTYDGIYS